MSDFDEEEPLASWEAAFLPDWEWEAYRKEDDDAYFGRVRSPHTYGRWEYGYFTQSQLEEAGAYRTDVDDGDVGELFPDGGSVDSYLERKRFVEEEKPYWLNVRGGTRFSGELRFSLENYFPDAHYRSALDELDGGVDREDG